MHPSALDFGKLFFETYCINLQGAVVHDVGAQNVNGSLRDVLPAHLSYVGVDFVAGNGVDIVLEDPYKLPFADASLDVLVCSSCFEHSQFFWLVFLEMLRVLKPQGLLYLNVPSNGSIHRYPVDCWRFYPDSGRALEAWAGRNGYSAQLMESFVGERSPDPHESGGAWHDFVAVYVKDRQHAAAYPERMLDSLLGWSNGYDSRTGAESRSQFLSPDHVELVANLRAMANLRAEQSAAAEREAASVERIASLLRTNQELARIEDQLRQELAAQSAQHQLIRNAHEAQIRSAHERLAAILHSRSWRFMAPARTMMSAVRVLLSSLRSLKRWLGAGGDKAAAEANLIRASGLFDEAFYRSANPDLPPGFDVIAHYCKHGWREGRDPSPRFSTRYYLESNPDIRDADMNPFLHYVTAGIREGRLARRRNVVSDEERRAAEARLAVEVEAIRESGLFDEAYYRAMNSDLSPEPGDAIRHFCEHGWREGRNPSPDFDTNYYLKTAPDILASGMNPFLHYVMAGMKEGRPAHPGASRSAEVLEREVGEIRASGQFDEAYYRAMNPDIQPPPADVIRHYCERGWLEGRNPSDDFDTKAYLAAYRDIREAGINPFWHYVVAGSLEMREARPGATARYEDDVWFGPTRDEVKLLAFYATPDWKALRGHSSMVEGETQPLLPHDDLGFYDPADHDVLERQASLARRHGIHGFCFTLTRDANGAPYSAALECMLGAPKLDMAFCLGIHSLDARGASGEGSLLRRACADKRAIRVEGAPVLLVRTCGAQQDVAAELEQVRATLVDQGIGRVFLVACWSEGDRAHLESACLAGACDALIDLPDPPVPRESGNYVMLQSGDLRTAPYSVIANHGALRAQALRSAAIPFYSTIAVGRDNTGSKDEDKLVYKRFNLKSYRRWLEAGLDCASHIPASDRRFLFLQSWNDWNGGQVLEPDRQGGYGRLNETSRALFGIRPGLLMPKVTVVVPNYNHQRFLRQRLDSIYGQTYRNIEVILMDDCSSDGSRAVLDEYAALHPEVTRTLYNDTNSGGPFRQWAKGIAAARGELVWIAESDDYCDEGFLDALVRSFDDEAVLLAYGKSVFVDHAGAPLPQGFEAYLNDLESAEKWDARYVETAHREVRAALGIKNTIPNASSVLFRRPVDMPLLDESWWLSMRVAGDWVFYLYLLRGGKIAFDPTAINYFRRYEGSTAQTTYRKAQYFQEVGVACRTVAALYDVPLDVLERNRNGYQAVYAHQVAGTDKEFGAWFDFDAVLRARAERLPNVVVSTMGFSPGGAEIFPIWLANEFKRQGVSVLLLSAGLNTREDGVRRMLRNDVPVVETSEVEPVKAIIEHFGIEVLNSHHWHMQKYPVQVPDVFDGLRAHVATLHGMIEHGNAFAVTEEELRIADGSVSTWVYTADKNLGPFVDLGMVQTKASRFVKMPNGIQTSRIVAVPRDHLGIPEDAFLLCCVSRAIPDKGWAETIESVQRARELSGRDIRLMLVGNGLVYDEYRRVGVPSFVHMVGFSENSAGHYASADMGIMLTKFRSESFPLTVVDCLFAGKPYIATNVGDIRNMLSSPEGMAGEVVELDEWEVPVEAAAQVIASFASDRAKYHEAQALVPKIASRYRIEAVASLYVDLFRKKAASGGGGEGENDATLLPYAGRA